MIAPLLELLGLLNCGTVPLGVWGMTKARTLRRKDGDCVSGGSIEILIRFLARRARLPVAICLSWFVNKFAQKREHCSESIAWLQDGRDARVIL